MLDSISNVLLALTVIVGLWLFHKETLLAVWPTIAAICLVWLVVHAAALRLADIENMIMILLLATWSPSLRAGLFALLRQRRQQGHLH